MAHGVKFFTPESGVPIPRKRLGRSPVRNAIEKLARGQSVLLPVSDSAQVGSAISLVKEEGRRAYVRRAVDGGVRVWRVA